MNDETIEESKQEVTATQPSEPSGRFFKKEKRVDYQNTQTKMKDGQETIGQNSTVKVYNPSVNIVEIDLGRDKSVRIPPYSLVELNREDLKSPGFETIKGFVKIY